MDRDVLFRTAQREADRVTSDLSRLLDDGIYSDEILYAALVARTNETINGPTALAGDPDTNLRGIANPFAKHVDVDILVRDDETISLGQRLFHRWNVVLHDFACSPGKDDTDLRDRLLNAITNKTGGGVAIIAAVLASFGVGPAVAAIIAALAIRLIVAPAADEVCKAWQANINASPSKTGSRGAAI